MYRVVLSPRISWGIFYLEVLFIMKKTSIKKDSQSTVAAAKPKNKFFTTRNLVSCAMLSACSALLMLAEFPLPFIAPSFYTLDFSEIPALIGAFSMGPVAGVIIEAIKILLKLIIKGTTTAYVGDLSNFVLGSIFVAVASLIYRVRKKKSFAVLGLAGGGFTMSLLAVFINAFIMIPFFSSMFNLPMDVIIGMGTEIFPVIDNIWSLCLLCVLPFNLIKVLLVSVVTILIYKPLSRLIKGKT